MNDSNKLSFIICIIIIEITTVINSFFVDLKGGTVDAERFQAEAIDWVLNGRFQFVTNAEFFKQYLGTIFWVFGESEFIASQFGILASVTACIYFIRINDELELRTPTWAIFAFLIWPSYLLRQATTLREPYLVLFIVMIAYFLILYKKRGSITDLAKLFAIMILSVLFHKATAVLFVFVSFYVLFFVMKQRLPSIVSRTFWLRVSIGSIAAIGMFLAVFVFSNVRGLKPVIALLTADAEYVERVLDYKSGRDFRTTYDATLDVSSPLAMMISIPKMFIYYMSYPFPWKIRAPLDVLASLEGMFRLGALFIIFKYSFQKLVTHPAARPVFVLGIIFCLIWAAGTSNYGTASRHHVTTNWIFIIAYIFYFSSIRRIKWR